MDIQLDDRIVLQLQEISRAQDREISAILKDAIAEYVERNTHETEFRARVRDAIATHRWLMDELEAR